MAAQHIVLVREVRTYRYSVPLAEGLEDHHAVDLLERQRARDAALLAHLDGKEGAIFVSEDKPTEWVCVIRPGVRK